MGLGLYMVGVIVEDMPRAAEFYRRLGVDVPDGAESEGHVEIKMSGLTFFLSTKEANARWDPARREISGDGYRIVLEFYLESRAALDAKYEELTAHGYVGHARRTTSPRARASRWSTIPTATPSCYRRSAATRSRTGYGRMFWFRWNRLSGSYFRLTSTRGS